MLCGKPTNNPKFCSRSCAAITNNRYAPKRELQGNCRTCHAKIRKKVSYCKECWQDRQVNWSETTMGELKGSDNANFGGRYPHLRALSRKWYIANSRPLICGICGYDKHVDICHIKDAKAFPESTKVSEVNAQSNLIALCKNHHWEFDNGIL